MVLLSFLLGGVAAVSAATIHARRDIADNSSTGTVVDLGSAGSYEGVIQNNGRYALAHKFAQPMRERHLRCFAAWSLGRAFLMPNHQSENYVLCRLKP